MLIIYAHHTPIKWLVKPPHPSIVPSKIRLYPVSPMIINISWLEKTALVQLKFPQKVQSCPSPRPRFQRSNPMPERCILQPACWHACLDTHFVWDHPRLFLPHEVGVPTVMGVHHHGWFIRDNPTKIDHDWGSPFFRKRPNSNGTKEGSPRSIALSCLLVVAELYGLWSKEV